jgi:hypothetical protein
MLTWGSSALRRRTWRSCGLAGSRAHSRKIGGVGGLPLFMLGCRTTAFRSSSAAISHGRPCTK